MSERRGRAVAWALALSTATLILAGLTILLLTLDNPPQGGWGFRGFSVLFALGAGPVGWLIMVRRPDNRIGVLLSLVALLAGGQLFLTEYASAGTRTSLPGGNLAALVNAFIWVPAVSLIAGAIPLVFPDGHLVSPRWRVVPGLLVGSSVALCAIIVAYPSAISTPRIVRRDFRVAIDDATLNSASFVVAAVLGLAILAAAASVFLRWRRSSGVVRQQLKWLALAVALVVSTMWLSLLPGSLPAAIFIAAVASVPIAVGIAVLRYRLYEIDTVINRTLVFGSLTAILTGAFAALTKLLQAVFVAVTGNESDAATVITTLILATSFVPLKKALESIAETRLSTHVTPAAPRDTATPPTVIPNVDELEAMLRRVVREELRSAHPEAVEEIPLA